MARDYTKDTTKAITKDKTNGEEWSKTHTIIKDRAIDFNNTNNKANTIFNTKDNIYDRTK